jgi:hypothetical protein
MLTFVIIDSRTARNETKKGKTCCLISDFFLLDLVPLVALLALTLQTFYDEGKIPE